MTLLAGVFPGAVETQRAAGTQAVTTIPFELATRHVMLSVTVNKSRPLSFVLDTGANLAIIRTEIAEELGLALEGRINVGGAGPGTQMGSYVRGAIWSLTGLPEFSQPIAMALPLPELPIAFGRPVDGILGGEFIRQFVLELDYDSRHIRLHAPASFSYRGQGETFPIEFTNVTHPVIRATVTPVGASPIQHRFLLDIGAGGALALHSPFVDQHKLLDGRTPTIRTIGGAGAGGRIAARLGRVESLTLGSFTLNRPLTLFSQDKAGAFANASLAGNIGAQVAMRFRTFLDYGRQRIILEPSARYAEPFDRASSGVALRALGGDFRTFRVLEVLEDSPATEAGIREGDVITAIDGTPAERLTLSAIVEMFEKSGTYVVTIRRGDETITVKLTPRRMI